MKPGPVWQKLHDHPHWPHHLPLPDSPIRPDDACGPCRDGYHGEECWGRQQPCSCRCRAVLGCEAFPDPTAPGVLDQRHQPKDCNCGCMAPPPLPELVEQGPATCQDGHLLTPDNVKNYRRHSRSYWRCRTCQRAYEKRRRDWLREWANQPPKSQNPAYHSGGYKRRTA